MSRKADAEGAPLEDIERSRDRLAGSEDSEREPQGTKEALQGTVGRLADILGAMSEYVVLQERDHTIVWANRAAADSLGREPEELLGHKCHRLWQDSGTRCEECPVARVWASGVPEEAEMASPDGRSWLVRGYPLLDEEDGVEAVLEVTQEITERRRAEAARTESEERYRALADSTSEGIVIHENGVIRDVNQRICDISGYQRDTLVGESIEKFLTPESIERVTTHIAEGHEEPYEVEGIAQDGSPLELEVIGKEVGYRGRTMRVAVVRDIKARKEAEWALRASEERYRLVTENLHDVVWTMDLDLNYTYISPSVERQRGFTPEEVLGQSVQDVMTPESLERVSDVVDMVLRPILEGEGDPHTSETLELDMYRKDGSIVHTEMSISLLLDEEGTPFGILGVTRDITERRAAEETIQRTESRYGLLAQNVDDIIFTLDKDLEFTYVSPSLERVTGFNTDELMGKGWQGIMTPDSLERTMEAVSDDALGLMARSKSAHTSSVVEAELVRKDGGTIWTEVKVSLLLDGGGKVTGLLGVARDITERRAAEEVIRQSEERYRILAENVADIIFVMDRDLTFSYVSPSFEKVTGFTIEELLEMGWQDMLTPGSLETAMSLMAERLLESMEKGTSPYESVILEMEIATKGGEPMWAEVNISLIQGPDGEVKGVLGVARDVTERHLSQEQFMEEKKRAELYLDLFGHDIRNINQGIMSYLELVLMRPGMDPEVVDYMKSVLEQATRINDLVAKVQRLTQLRTQRVETEVVDAGKLIRGAIDYVVAKHPERSITVNGEEKVAMVQVLGSKLLLDVFTSILDNAIRFDRNAEVVVDLDCEASGEGDRVRFSIADRGPGIPDYMKEKVFKRLDQPEGGVKGSGLGLTVVWEIIKRMDGRVWVEDRVPGDPSKGSKFMVELWRAGKDAPQT